MALVLVGTSAGCRTFTDSGEANLELAGRQVCALAPDVDGGCLAVVGGNEVWRRNARAEWLPVATTGISLNSVASVGGTIFAGSGDGAAMVRITGSNGAERLVGFDNVPGRSEWFANGPPLHVRALTATADGGAIMAAVHVGGIPRSTDGGETWLPTVPIDFDVHEVRAHPSSPLVAAAAAVGLCLSHDHGRNWEVIAENLEITNSLAVAVLQDEVLFSIQDGPFAKRSQVWRWQIAGKRLEQVREGLPQWLKGKVDTAHIAAGETRAAIVDRGGNFWLSEAGSAGWKCIASDLYDAYGGVLLL